MDPELKMREFHFADGRAMAVFERDEGLSLWASSFLAMLEEGKAPNYLEAILLDEQSGKSVVVTVRYQEGKTPHQLYAEEKEENERLWARIAELERGVR